MNLKEKLYLACNDFLYERHKVVINRIQSIQESLNSETKSSAGDKHETGRAMLQLEREKAGNQLLAIEQQQKVLKRISVQNSTDVIRLGSVVETDKKKFYLAISVGQLVVENQTYYGVAAASPIGKLLIGKRVGDEITFNNITYSIKNVL